LKNKKNVNKEYNERKKEFLKKKKKKTCQKNTKKIISTKLNQKNEIEKKNLG